MTTIVEFIKLFENNRDHYLSIESHVENVCKKNLRKNKVDFLWQSRVKAVDSLAEKLNGRRDMYQNEADNVADIKDLVGARILLLRSGDAPLVEQVINDLFDIRNDAQHPKTGAVSSHVRFRGYDAHHFYVTRRGLPGEQHKDPIIEIQVISVVMWTWATLNHDIEYKVLKGDQPKSVRSALEALLGLANVTAVVTGLVEDLLCSDPKSPLRQQDNLSAGAAMEIRDFLIENRNQLYSKPNAPSDLSDKDLADRISFLKWISSIDFDADQKTILSQRWPGTGNWLYENYLFQHWFLSRNSRVLWCRGTPGSGKSVLISGVVDYIRNKHAQDEGVGVAFAYFRYYSAGVQRPENILTAFVKELCRRMKQVPIELLDSFRFHSQNDTRPDLQECVEQFDLAVRNFKEVFIIVDALDECEYEAKMLILDLIGDAARKFPCIKFLVASRPENDIREYFKDLRVPIVEVHAQKDIELYLKSRIDQLTAPLGSSGKPKSQRLRIQSATTKDEVFQVLVDRAEGLFLWAKLQLDNLCRQMNEKDIKTELYSLPKGLDATYSRILDQIEEQPKALRRIGMKCLMWVFNARRPLTLSELRDAVAVDEGQTRFEDIAEIREDYTFEYLIDSCRNLLVSQDDPRKLLIGQEIVRPLHYTVQKFLDQRPMSVLGRQDYPLLNSIWDRNELAKSCLIYLELAYAHRISMRDDNKVNLSWSQFRLLFPFAWYCYEYFDDHLIDAPTMTPDLLDLARSLLSMNDRALAFLLQVRQQGYDRFDELYEVVNAKTVIILTHLYEVPWLLSYTEWNNSRVHPCTLHFACANGYYAGVNRLIAMGHDTNTENASGETPLAIVADSHRNPQLFPTRHPEWNYARISIARLLLDHGAQPNKETRSIRPAITTSAYKGDIEFVKLLLEFNVDLNGVDSHHPNALYAASKNRHKDIAKLLLQHGALPSIEALVEAAEDEDDKLVDFLLDQGLDVNATNPEDRSHFYAASMMQRPEWMEQILSRSRGAVSLGYSWGFKAEYVGCPGSALLKAARCGYVNAVEMLLTRGAHIHGSGLDETPILAAAAALGRGRLVQLLLAGGMDPDRKDPEGGTPLLKAIGECSHPLDLQIVDVLLQAGANVNAREDTNSDIPSASPMLSASPLQVATLVGSAQIVKLLIQRGADVKASGPVKIDYQTRELFGINRKYAERTALQIACAASRRLRAPWHARLEIIRELLRAGADANATDEYGITPLQLASTYGGDGDEATQIVKLLLQSGVDANAHWFDSSNDSTPITFENSYALDWNPPEIVGSRFNKLLLSVPPVHRASFRGHAEILAMLLKAGADANVQSYLGTPIEAAYMGYYGSNELGGAWAKVIEVLRQEGAREPGQYCHIGVRCKGPMCEEEERSISSDLQYGGRLEWIWGARYKCVNCNSYNLCAGCKAWYDRNYDEEDDDISLEDMSDCDIPDCTENRHRMIRLTVREDIVDR